MSLKLLTNNKSKLSLPLRKPVFQLPLVLSVCIPGVSERTGVATAGLLFGGGGNPKEYHPSGTQGSSWAQWVAPGRHKAQGTPELERQGSLCTCGGWWWRKLLDLSLSPRNRRVVKNLLTPPFIPVAILEG